MACTVCGEVRGAMARYLSAEIASALEPSHEVDPRRHVAFP
ncbi:MAG TPA: hypothetical protein VE760_01435 [Acidimicrobiales bacterium]|nr:hypothetical protein [Acidimicrobiales bacterium]